MVEVINVTIHWFRSIQTARSDGNVAHPHEWAAGSRGLEEEDRCVLVGTYYKYASSLGAGLSSRIRRPPRAPAHLLRVHPVKAERAVLAPVERVDLRHVLRRDLKVVQVRVGHDARRLGRLGQRAEAARARAQRGKGEGEGGEGKREDRDAENGQTTYPCWRDHRTSTCETSLLYCARRDRQLGARKAGNHSQGRTFCETACRIGLSNPPRTSGQYACTTMPFSRQ